jgi:hypothetical protein
VSEYGEELVREYLESDNYGGQWFVLMNHKVEVKTKHSPAKEIDVLAVKINDKNKIIDKIFGEVKSWINYTVDADNLWYINKHVFNNRYLKKEAENILGKNYRKVVFCPIIPKQERGLKKFEKFKKEHEIDVITFENMLALLKERAGNLPTQYNPNHMITHTFKHLEKAGFLRTNED